MKKKGFFLVLAPIFLLLLFACGGGDDNNSSTDTISMYSAYSAAQTDNSLDADGFMWGTETYESASTDASIRSAINDTLKTKHVKFRIFDASFQYSGSSFSPINCINGTAACSNMDETVALFKANGWSMVPMLSHDMNDYLITREDIDRFVNFADWFISRYRNDASIKYVELQNAPQMTWHGTVGQLLDLTNGTYDRIKSKNPDILVGTPGFEWAGSSSTAISQMEYYLDKDNSAKFDFWAFHGYPDSCADGIAAPTITSPIKYKGIPGILEIRRKLDSNGWQSRLIIDTEHTSLLPPLGLLWAPDADSLSAAYMVQELLLKRTLQNQGKTALAGILPLKIAPRGTVGEFAWASLNSDGSLTETVKAVALLWSKLDKYGYHSHLSGEFDDENLWIEKFRSGANKELYVYFKPFPACAQFDGETVTYTLNLSSMPSSAVVTHIDGGTTNISPAQTITLEGVNSPQFLEIVYPP